ncbi:MAG TPA: sigma factor-like helix-turn-helix DNA-binding protein [Phenylobacterium sp.]
MDREAFTDEAARALRRAWFTYLDEVEPLREPLHAYGMRLTGNVWDAEDLVQETLLKGFAMIGRGDLHGPGSPVANPRAYLFRTATNLWLDGERRKARERAVLADPPPQPVEAAPEAVRSAGERLFSETAPQERAAVILKDVFSFSLEEIADQLRTTVGGVKAALHRGRAALKSAGAEPKAQSGGGPSRELVDRFIDAFRSRDVATITACLTESCEIHVPGVGGGRGRRGGWAEASVAHGANVRLEPALYHGENVILAFHEGQGLYDVIRLEEADGLVSHLTNYCFTPDTLHIIGAELGVPVAPWGYHQPPEVLVDMIRTTTLPWGEGMKLH